MIVLRKAYRAKLIYLCALFLTLLLPLATLVGCDQPAPQYTSINLGIAAAALQSPVKGPLPDTTALHVGITFKVDPQVLNLVGQRPLQPGQGEQSQRQRAPSYDQIDHLKGYRQPECPALPRPQSLSTETGNNPNQEKKPRQEHSKNSYNSRWCSTTMRDIIDTCEATEKSDQTYDDQEHTMYS
jgi:hypothetical protein